MLFCYKGKVLPIHLPFYKQNQEGSPLEKSFFSCWEKPAMVNWENPKEKKCSVCLILELRNEQILLKRHNNFSRTEKVSRAYPEAYLKPSQISMMEFFSWKAPSSTFDTILNTPRRLFRIAKVLRLSEGGKVKEWSIYLKVSEISHMKFPNFFIFSFKITRNNYHYDI